MLHNIFVSIPKLSVKIQKVSQCLPYCKIGPGLPIYL